MLRNGRIFIVLAALLAGGCTHARTTRAPGVEIPATVASDGDMATALNALALLASNDPQREALRARVIGYLCEHVHDAVDAGEYAQAVETLQRAAQVYSARELRDGHAEDPRLAKAARALYGVAAKRGREMPGLFALAVTLEFGGKEGRAWALERWAELGAWVDSGAEHSRDPMMATDREQLIEDTVAVFPSSWLTDELATIYLARFLRSQQGYDASARAQYTGYLLARLYLRGDDLEGALRAMDAVKLDEPTRRLRELIARAHKGGKSPQPFVDLLAYLEPEEADQLPASVVAQGWGIVENMARRALAVDAKEPHANLGLARALRQQGLVTAAEIHYERSLAQREDVFEAWAELALVKQISLARLAQTDPDRARERLESIEAFHRRAAELWHDRPIRPGLADAYTTVASTLFERGNPGAAEKLMMDAVAIEPRPEALDLLATIATRRGELDRARQHYQALMDLPFDDQIDRIEWEIRTRIQLAGVAVLAGDRTASTHQLDSALRQLNTILSFPRTSVERRAAHLTQRSRVFFYVGEDELAMQDFRAAVSAAGDEPQVFAEPLVFAVTHGYLDQALEVFRQSLEREQLDPELKLYFAMWVDDLSVRTRGEHARDAVQYLESFEGDAWIGLLGQHALGHKTLDELLVRAGDPGERAEAYFYEGLRRWREGERAAGLALMKRVLETDMMSFFEYEMAQHYLRWQELPKTARAPLPPGNSKL